MFEGPKGLNFDSFKKNFFPHLYAAAADRDDEYDIAAAEIRHEIEQNGPQQPELIESRLYKVEDKLKTKFSNCFHSVRKAFLMLDTDYDGYITVEDILKYFGTDTDINFADLKKLMVDKDSKKEGKIGYSDFSKWLGSAIHMSEGFYFRHDSIRNPFYEMNREKEKTSSLAHDKKLSAQALLQGDVENLIL